MHVLMRVGMIEAQPDGSERRELRPDFRRQPPANLRPKEVVDPKTELVRGELAVRVRQTRRWPNGRTLDHHQMQADAQPRQSPCTTDRIGGGGTGDHQARGRQQAIAASLLDGLVDPLGKAEVVGCKNDFSQIGLCDCTVRTRRVRSGQMNRYRRRPQFSGTRQGISGYGQAAVRLMGRIQRAGVAGAVDMQVSDKAA
jgi:hypothetical protein